MRDLAKLGILRDMAAPCCPSVLKRADTGWGTHRTLDVVSCSSMMIPGVNRCLEFYVSYWREGPVGHTFLSFLFDNAPPLSTSIETRPEIGKGLKESIYWGGLLEVRVCRLRLRDQAAVDDRSSREALALNACSVVHFLRSARSMAR